MILLKETSIATLKVHTIRRAECAIP